MESRLSRNPVFHGWRPRGKEGEERGNAAHSRRRQSGAEKSNRFDQEKFSEQRASDRSQSVESVKNADGCSEFVILQRRVLEQNRQGQSHCRGWNQEDGKG